MAVPDDNNNGNCIAPFHTITVGIVLTAARAVGEAPRKPAAIAAGILGQALTEKGGRCGCSGENRLDRRETENSKTDEPVIVGSAETAGMPEGDWWQKECS